MRIYFHSLPLSDIITLLPVLLFLTTLSLPFTSASQSGKPLYLSSSKRISPPQKYGLFSYSRHPAGLPAFNPLHGVEGILVHRGIDGDVGDGLVLNRDFESGLDIGDGNLGDGGGGRMYLDRMIWIGGSELPELKGRVESDLKKRRKGSSDNDGEGEWSGDDDGEAGGDRPSGWDGGQSGHSGGSSGQGKGYRNEGGRGSHTKEGGGSGGVDGDGGDEQSGWSDKSQGQSRGGTFGVKDSESNNYEDNGSYGSRSKGKGSYTYGAGSGESQWTDSSDGGNDVDEGPGRKKGEYGEGGKYSSSSDDGGHRGDGNQRGPWNNGKYQNTNDQFDDTDSPPNGKYGTQSSSTSDSQASSSWDDTPDTASYNAEASSPSATPYSGGGAHRLAQSQYGDPAHSDCARLMQFYRAMSGSGEWVRNDGWASDDDTECCGWFGVTCSAGKRVTALNLSGNGLRGSLKGTSGNTLFALTGLLKV
jgi:hypothetical protein